MDEPNREITFEGCFNFRDLGGYRSGDGRWTRWRRLFRSDHLAELSDSDCELAEGELGIVTVLDLRTPATASQSPSKLGARCVNLPLLSDAAAARARSRIPHASTNTFMRETRAVADEVMIAGVFALLADESSYPLVFHCITGKDRTGLIAALVLGVLGVNDEEIARDYAMSEPNMARYIERSRKQGRLPADGSFPEDLPRSFFETPPDGMLSLLGELRARHGSIRDYVRSCGADAAALAGLERALLTRTEDT